MKQYTCSICKETFDEAWTDEEAVSELKETFPGFKVTECSVVCDDCYKKLVPQISG